MSLPVAVPFLLLCELDSPIVVLLSLILLPCLACFLISVSSFKVNFFLKLSSFTFSFTRLVTFCYSWSCQSILIRARAGHFLRPPVDAQKDQVLPSCTMMSIFFRVFESILYVFHPQQQRPTDRRRGVRQVLRNPGTRSLDGACQFQGDRHQQRRSAVPRRIHGGRAQILHGAVGHAESIAVLLGTAGINWEPLPRCACRTCICVSLGIHSERHTSVTPPLPIRAFQKTSGGLLASQSYSNSGCETSWGCAKTRNRVHEWAWWCCALTCFHSPRLSTACCSWTNRSTNATATFLDRLLGKWSPNDKKSFARSTMKMFLCTLKFLSRHIFRILFIMRHTHLCIRSKPIIP